MEAKTALFESCESVDGPVLGDACGTIVVTCGGAAADDRVVVVGGRLSRFSLCALYALFRMSDRATCCSSEVRL